LDFCLAEAIDWYFIPPRSPHFSGLWEAAVKIAKVVNSRPLVSISENPADLDVLTPAHCFNGGPLSSFVEPDVTSLNFNRFGWKATRGLLEADLLVPMEGRILTPQSLAWLSMT